MLTVWVADEGKQHRDEIDQVQNRRSPFLVRDRKRKVSEGLTHT
ncbi:hypothetical protein [Streptomyces sp. NPDC048825]